MNKKNKTSHIAFRQVKLNLNSATSSSADTLANVEIHQFLKEKGRQMWESLYIKHLSKALPAELTVSPFSDCFFHMPAMKGQENWMNVVDNMNGDIIVSVFCYHHKSPNVRHPSGTIEGTPAVFINRYPKEGDNLFKSPLCTDYIPRDTFFRITTAKGFGCYVMFLQVVDSSSGFEFQLFPEIGVTHKTWLNRNIHLK
jgi:hypothetical protein